MGRPVGVALPLMINEVQAHDSEVIDKRQTKSITTLFMLQRYKLFLTYASELGYICIYEKKIVSLHQNCKKMKNRLLFILSTLVVAINLLAQNQNPQYISYIAQYREMAIEQQIKHRIPAAITMAQGLLESGAGQSELAVKANNHFGIKCASDWKGRTYTHDDETKNECFRKYASPANSYEDHSLFLKRKRYESLFTLPLTDYKGWAHGLKACGYATDPKYADKLIRIIEQYNLQDLTLDKHLQDAGLVSEKDTTWQEVTTDKLVETPVEEYAIQDHIEVFANHKSGRINGVRYIVANEGESFASLAVFLNMYERTLRKYNDALDARELTTGDIIYIYPKKNKASKKTPFHYFKSGEDAWQIAQKYGIKVKSLYKINRIPYGTPLTTNQRLDLR